jgi:hypothetical protein
MLSLYSKLKQLDWEHTCHVLSHRQDKTLDHDVTRDFTSKIHQIRFGSTTTQIRAKKISILKFIAHTYYCQFQNSHMQTFNETNRIAITNGILPYFPLLKKPSTYMQIGK